MYFRTIHLGRGKESGKGETFIHGFRPPLVRDLPDGMCTHQYFFLNQDYFVKFIFMEIGKSSPL